MNKLSRRDLLKFAGTFFAFIPTYKILSQSQKIFAPHDPAIKPIAISAEDLMVSKYESGIIDSVSQNQIVLHNYKGVVTLHYSNDTLIWDGIDWVAKIGFEIGDRIIAWGKRNDDGSLTCEKLYINIVNFIGKVTEVVENQSSGDFTSSLVITERFHGEQKINFVPLTIIDNGEIDRRNYKDFSFIPKKNETIQIIGRTMKDKTTLAVVVYYF